MPRLPQLPSAFRLFARIDRFTTECPACGQLISAHFDRQIGRVRRALMRRRQATGSTADPGMQYNPLTSRLTCPQCGRVWGVGLLLYPVVPRSPPSQPYDQRPTWKQLLSLRQLATGFILEQPIRGSDSLNIVVEGSCTCVEVEGRVRVTPSCPVHGWAEQLPATPPPMAELDPPVGGEEDPFSRAHGGKSGTLPPKPNDHNE